MHTYVWLVLHVCDTSLNLHSIRSVKIIFLFLMSDFVVVFKIHKQHDSNIAPSDLITAIRENENRVFRTLGWTLLTQLKCFQLKPCVFLQHSLVQQEPRDPINLDRHSKPLSFEIMYFIFQTTIPNLFSSMNNLELQLSFQNIP